MFSTAESIASIPGSSPVEIDWEFWWGSTATRITSFSKVRKRANDLYCLNVLEQAQRKEEEKRNKEEIGNIMF